VMYPLDANQFSGVKRFAIAAGRETGDPAGMNYKVPRERLI
jgi:hypothetical protein